jgi:hypothetical protein
MVPSMVTPLRLEAKPRPILDDREFLDRDGRCVTITTPFAVRRFDMHRPVCPCFVASMALACIVWAPDPPGKVLVFGPIE